MGGVVCSARDWLLLLVWKGEGAASAGWCGLVGAGGDGWLLTRELAGFLRLLVSKYSGGQQDSCLVCS